MAFYFRDSGHFSKNSLSYGIIQLKKQNPSHFHIPPNGLPLPSRYQHYSSQDLLRDLVQLRWGRGTPCSTLQGCPAMLVSQISQPSQTYHTLYTTVIFSQYIFMTASVLFPIREFPHNKEASSVGISVLI